MSDIQNNKPDHYSHDLVRELLKDRRRERFWKNFRFLIVVGFAFLILFLSTGEGGEPELEGYGNKGDYVALVRLDGMIGPDLSFSADHLIPILKNAFSDKKAKGVILDINSGGGTPVQASIIHDAILKFKKHYKKNVVVVGEDLLASGAYYVAVSADKIYVNPNTMTGSIGVIMEGFGFNDIMKKVGIDRRIYAAGAHKDRLDPFLPVNPADKEKIEKVIAEVHNNFIQAVVEGRKGKLHGDQNELFSGDFWVGQTALNLGLVDALGNLPDAMQNEFKVTRYRDYSESKNPLKAIFSKFGMMFDLPLNQTDKRLVAKF